MRNLWLFLFLIARFSLSAQQVQNDECSRAIPITQVVNYCSDAQAYSTQNATPSPEERPSCFPDETNMRDVWFSFVARATDVNISITGNTALSPGGTLTLPQLAVYAGNCGNLIQAACISDGFGANAVQTFVSQLKIGAVYYIRVGGRNGNSGTFKLCINNFNQAPATSSDCATANILCSKAPFTVDFVRGEGKDKNEIVGVCGRLGCQPEETQSSWFRWTCQQAGTLTFKITPLNPTDDLDFIVFELPKDLNDCGNKKAVRCMSAGENVGQPINLWRNCTGATGLKEGEKDNVEYCGCESGYNNFIAPLDMVAGRSYTLVVNNFSASGSGFTIEFGGTGTFLGPQANFTFDQTSACVGKPVTLTDSSFFSGTISGWDWYMGSETTPTTTTGKGPQQVRFDRPGNQTVVLNVRTTDGCIVSAVKTIPVVCCNDHFSTSANLKNPLCPDAKTGSIDLQVSSVYPQYQYNWDNGQRTQDLSLLPSGSFTVTVTDISTCDTTLQFSLTEPPPLEISTVIKMPTCNGGRDGILNVLAGGATPPFQYKFPGEQDYTSINSIYNIPVGDYLIELRDQNNCVYDSIIPVRELELTLDPDVVAVTMPSCFGYSDGKIVVQIDNGLPPYRYNWNDGRGFQDASSLQQIKSGVFKIEVIDANLCKGDFVFDVKDFDVVGVQAAILDVLCYGGSDGQVEVVGTGGAGGYRYRWQNGSEQATRDRLTAGTYPIRVEDQNQCTLDTFVVVQEPPLLDILDIEAVDVLCFGDTTGQISVLGTGGTAPYSYSIGSIVFKSDNVFPDLGAGDYIVTVRDANGCTSAEQVRILEPDLLTVYAGPDQVIDLGEQAKLQAIPSEVPVTFQWSPADLLNCSSCAAPIAQPQRTGYFAVTVTNPNGCTSIDSLAIIVQKNRPLYIPNSFSPNADGANDYFTIYGGLSARSIRVLRVFDRWGELLFEGKDLPLGSEPLGWDGTFKGEALPSAVYVYYGEVEFVDGEVLTLKGDVSLLR